MKRNFTAKGLFLLLAFAIASVVNTARAQVEWGITVGANMANLKGTDYTGAKGTFIPDSSRAKFSGITRMRIGIFMDYPLNAYFSFSPGIAYSVKGAVQKIDSGYTVVDFPPGWTDKYKTVSNIDLNYIELPILFRFSTPLGNPTAMYPYENSVKPFYLDFVAGPYFAYMLSNKNDASYTFTRFSTNDTSATYNFSRKVKTSSSIPTIGKIDYGLVVGAAIKWRFNRKSYLYLEGRYTMGLANLNKGYWDKYVTNPEDPTKPPIKISPKITNTGMLTVSLGFVTNFSKRRYFGLQKNDKNRP